MRPRLAFWYLVLAMLFESAYSNLKEVCKPVRFTLNMKESTTVPKLILIQWIPRVYQEIKLSVRGGCAQASRDYKWFSSDRTIVSVSSLGVIYAKRPGIVTVKAVSACDPQNFDLIVVKVFANHYKSYDMDDMDVNLADPISMPSNLFMIAITLVFLLTALIGHLIVVSFPANPHYEPCPSASRSDHDCHETKRLRRTLTTVVVRKKISLKIYRRRWFLGHISNVTVAASLN